MMEIDKFLDLPDEVVSLVLSTLSVPFCGHDCFVEETESACPQCFAACQSGEMWGDTRTLVALSQTCKRMKLLAVPFMVMHREKIERMFSRMLQVYVPHGCIRRDLNLPLKYSLRNGENPNRRTVSLPCRWNYLGRGRALGTLLHYAVEFDNVEAVSILIKHGADPSVPDSHSWTPLHLAAAKGRLATAEALLQHGTNPNLRGGFDDDVRGGWCPLHLAAVQADASMIDLLLAYGADVGRRAGRYGDTPLHEFACNGKDIACFPGSLRRAHNDVMRAMRTLITVAGDGPGGLTCQNAKGFTPQQKANDWDVWLFPLLESSEYSGRTPPREAKTTKKCTKGTTRSTSCIVTNVHSPRNHR